MRPLILFVSAVLVGMVAAVAAASADWLTDTRKKCRIFDSQSEGLEAQWDGPCLGNYADGAGTLVLLRNGTPIQRATGLWKAGKLTGRDVDYRWLDRGESYFGSFRDGKIEGKGKMTWADGSIYEGDWADDAMSGNGTYSFANRDRYEGGFLSGKFQGRGVYTWESGTTYGGAWLVGRADGNGVKKDAGGGIIHSGKWSRGCSIGGAKAAAVGTTLDECMKRR